MHDYQAENEAILRKEDPELLAELADASAEGVHVGEARKGGLTAQLDNLYVHSKYDPRKEAGKCIEGEPAVAHIHFGLGLGHLLEADTPSKDGAMVIFEPHVSLAAAALKYTPLAKVLRAKRAHLCCTLPRFKEHLNGILKGDRPYQLRVLPFHGRLFPQMVTHVKEAVAEAHKNSEIALHTLERNSAYLTHGALAGLPLTTRLRGVEALEGRFKDVPAVVISAGPSLDQNLADLVPYADRCLIIAIARTARPLQRLGIHPHILVHNEPKPFYSFIKGCTNLKETAFVLSLQGERTYYAHPHGPTFVFQNPANFTGRWISELYPNLKKAHLETGGSVSTEAFSLAVLAGCNPIVMLGQDLAVKAGRYYAQAESNKRFLHLDKDVRQVPGYFGHPVTSLSTYYSYARWFGDMAEQLTAQHPHLTLINATEGGVHLAGFENMKLRHVAQKYFRKKTGPTEQLLEAAEVGVDQQLSPDELSALTRRAQDRLSAFEALIKDFGHYRARLSPLIQPLKTRNLGTVQKELPRLDQFKQRFVQLNQDFFVLSGFMQGELIECNRKRRNAKVAKGRNDLENLGFQITSDLNDFAMTIDCTAIGVKRMRKALTEMVSVQTALV